MCQTGYIHTSYLITYRYTEKRLDGDYLKREFQVILS